MDGCVMVVRWWGIGNADGRLKDAVWWIGDDGSVVVTGGCIYGG